MPLSVRLSICEEESGFGLAASLAIFSAAFLSLSAAARAAAAAFALALMLALGGGGAAASSVEEPEADSDESARRAAPMDAAGLWRSAKLLRAAPAPSLKDACDARADVVRAKRPRRSMVAWIRRALHVAVRAIR